MARASRHLGVALSPPGPRTVLIAPWTTGRAYELTSDEATERATMARWLGIFFASGATLALAGLLLPHVPYRNTGATALLAASGYPVALLLFWCGRRLSIGAFHVLTAAGTLIVTLAIALGHGSRLADLSPLFYMWVPIFAFTFFTARAALVQVLWIAASYSVVLSFQADPAIISQCVIVIGVLTVTSGAVHSLVRQITRLARTDSLTGLANRRVFDERLAAEMARARRTLTPVCVAVIDLDDFKRVNDELGHQAGDALLAQLAPCWIPELRATDCLARYGGDEFAMVFPDTAISRAAQVIDRLRNAAPDVSFSAGIAQADTTDDADSLVSRADSDLYAAKHRRSTVPRTAHSTRHPN